MALPTSSANSAAVAAATEDSSLFRSEQMTLIELYMPTEIAHATVAELGELGLVQFRDLNADANAFQRTYVNELRRFDEVERKLRFLWANIVKNKTLTTGLAGVGAANAAGPDAGHVAPRPQELEEMSVSIDGHEERLFQLNQSYETFQRQLMELIERKVVLTEAEGFFRHASARPADMRRSIDDPDVMLLGDNRYDRRSSVVDLIDSFGRSLDSLAASGNGSTEVDSSRRYLNNNINTSEISVKFITGVISRSRMIPFERVLWRSLRGNLLMNHVEINEPIMDPISDSEVDKNVFIVFAHGEMLLAKARRIAESMGATLYNISSSDEQRHEDLISVMARIDDINSILLNTNRERDTELSRIADNISGWMSAVKKEKLIYHTMNKFRQHEGGHRSLFAEGWCPIRSLSEVQSTLNFATMQAGSSQPAVMRTLSTKMEPPTFHRTNKFTSAFQELVNAYGVAKYREVNPALFAIISFPFLFAVMFGDFGHGLIMFAVAVYLCLNEKKFEHFDGGEMFSMLFGGRYLVLMMGAFSVYTGLIYNDIFSRSVSFFSSRWEFPQEGRGNKTLTAIHVGGAGSVYPFGIDPVWNQAENNLLFLNSYKMKMAVILGAVQMFGGVILSLYNHRYFKKKINIYCEFIPQILFMGCIVGYLVFIVIYKWTVDWNATDDDGNPIYKNSPPALLNTLILMFLSPGKVAPEDQLYRGQAFVQLVLIMIAVVCVPWMLFAKPYLLKREHDRTAAMGYQQISTTSARISNARLSDIDPADIAANGFPHAGETEEMIHDKPFDFGDIMIGQSIHTIEFCLNCISHTASYLRLWALSLAHAQLSEVLWKMTLEGAANAGTHFARTLLFVVGFYLWFVMTIGTLIGMEGMSAFLHALRLHWVEFNDKFYGGTGELFEPLSFAEIHRERQRQMLDLAAGTATLESFASSQ
ncbi:V0/A0 complex, 116-kDa subunit of ATPase [Ramicandelaber brevisporus]|nr:V0/A0 complex, 116-kDa subunit of ATPase [Ramicandelaber brevisporus]